MNKGPVVELLNLFNDLHNVFILKHVVLAHSLRPVLGAGAPHQCISAKNVFCHCVWRQTVC